MYAGSILQTHGHLGGLIVYSLRIESIVDTLGSDREELTSLQDILNRIRWIRFLELHFEDIWAD